MLRIRPKVLAIVGAMAVLVGAVCCMAFAVAQTSCQNGPNGSLTIDPQLANLCSGDAWGARVGFIVLAFGAVLVLLAGIAATPRYSDRRKAPPAVPDER